MFSESEYYAAFKKVRNKFRKHNYYDLIGGALKYINAPTKDKFESIKRHPWLVLLVIKWVLLDDNYPNKLGESAGDSEVLSILQSAYELSEKIRMPTEYEHLVLFFRNIAFQQFPYQIDFRYAHISRQSIIFSTLEDNHFIKKNFRDKTGLEIQDFLDLSLMTLTRFLDTNELVLPNTWFSSIYSSYSPEKIESFLSLLSKNINEIREILINKDGRKRLAAENYELTPFIKYPLIKSPNGYLLAHRNLLFRRLEYFIYDTMRDINAARFMDKFGELFERYVENSIKYSDVNYVTEEDIKTALGKTGNQIDFIIQEGVANIYIDAKAVEINSQGKSTHLAKILRDKTKTSILKAIKQSHDVIRKLTEKENCGIQKSEINYLLVITLKNLYLGSGTTYYEAIAKDKMDEIYSEYDSYPCIPPENMYFLTIDELDILVGILRQKRVTLSEIIDIAKENDKDPHTRKFDFLQHLHHIDSQPETPKYLDVEKDKIFDRIQAALGA